MRRRVVQVAIAFAVLVVAMQLRTLGRRSSVVLSVVSRPAAVAAPWLPTSSRAPSDTAAIRHVARTAVSNIDPTSVRDVVIRGDTAWVTATARVRGTANTYQLIRSGGEWRVWKLKRQCPRGPTSCSSAT